MSEPRCDACKYWVVSPDPALSGASWDEDERQGQCRRNAPYPWNNDLAYQMLEYLSTTAWHMIPPELIEKHRKEFEHWEDVASQPGLTSWPGTVASDWCGEFKKRP